MDCDLCGVFGQRNRCGHYRGDIMDALERCARMVRDAEDSRGRMPDAHYVDHAEWEAIANVIAGQKYVEPGKAMATLEVCGVPVRKFEIIGARNPQRNLWTFR
jgi:hypothetical protein